MAVDRSSFFYRQTSGIRITVRPAYLPDRSAPMFGQFAFAYRVRIENVGNAPAQLRRRRWLIHDSVAGDSVVEGEGVVGEQPYLQRGQVHEYQSHCVLQSPQGWMEGSYYFVRDDGTSFDAVIPRFTLIAAPRADTMT